MNARKARHGYCPRDELLFKGRFSHSCPEASRASVPQCTPRHPTYGMGARPCVTRTRNVQPPCGYTPFHLHRNQRSRRRTAAQGACNHPAVIRPSIFTTTSGQGANRRTRSMQPPRGCAPPQLRYNQWSNLWHGGPCPHVIHPARRFLGAGSLHRRSCQYRASSRPSQKTKKINFQNRCGDPRHPAHGPTKTLSIEVTGQLAMGAGVAVGVTIGGPAVTASTGA